MKSLMRNHEIYPLAGMPGTARAFTVDCVRVPEGITIMTATISAEARHEVLTVRLASLRSERAQVLAETIPTAAGDLADRATNVDGHVRLAMLERRIATVEGELAVTHQPSPRAANDAIAVGDVVTLDWGDGPESLLLGSVDQAGDGFDVITPNSPLGRALQGARVGSTVTYSIGHRTLKATINARH
jgi:transcription elongation factor GreA